MLHFGIQIWTNPFRLDTKIYFSLQNSAKSHRTRKIESKIRVTLLRNETKQNIDSISFSTTKPSIKPLTSIGLLWIWHYPTEFPRTILTNNFIAYGSSKVSWRPDCIFVIHQPWQSVFSMVYSNCCRSCSFEPEIIKIGQTSHKMYSNNIVNFQESTTILNVCSKVWKRIECTTYL